MAPKISIFTKNMELTDRVQEYVEKKVSKLDRYISGVDDIRVDLGAEKSMRNPADRQVAQITMRGRGYILRTEERADDVFAAIDLSVDKIQRKIERFKGKRVRGRGDGSALGETMQQETETPEEAVETSRIVRRKSFALTPIDEEEAIEQMVALGHDSFFIFFNVATNAINVLYARRDGTYGLIEPHLR